MDIDKCCLNVSSADLGPFSRLFFASAVVLHPEPHRPVPLEPLLTTLERITSVPGSAIETEQPLKNQPTQMI